MPSIFDEVRKLGLPIGEYVVVGSGPLAARGIRAFVDIDLLVTGSLFGRLVAEGWERATGFSDRPKATFGIFEAYRDLLSGSYRPNTESLIHSADIIEGIPFLALKELIAFKNAVGREKDLRDVQLIEAYLRR